MNVSTSLPPLFVANRRSAYPRVLEGDEQARALRHFQETLGRGGLDLLQPFSLGALSLLDVKDRFSSHGPSDLGLVVGNTRALWPAFQKHLRGLGVRSTDELGPDPLDIYVEELIQGALAELAEGSAIGAEVVFAHDLSPAPIPIQRIAEVAGLARLGPAHLSVHTRLGPWFALRAVIALSVPAGAGAHLSASPSDVHPCDSCAAPCRRALSSALLGHATAPPSEDAPAPPPGLSEKQKRWLEVRDACPVGRQHRYSDAQILYHYDRRREALLGEPKQRR